MLNSPKQYIIIHDGVLEINDTESYNEVMSFVNETKTRLIPLQEIALTIIHCSCEKHCNPKFDRQKNLLQSKIPSISRKVLALETQSQDLYICNSYQIPGNKHEISQTDDEKELTQSLFHSTLIEPTKPLKRSGPIIEQVAIKKKKTETQTTITNLFSLKR